MALIPVGMQRTVAISLFAATALASWPAFSQSFTIQPGQTEGQKVMGNAGDTGTVKAGGKISTSGVGEDGVRMEHDHQRLTNAGSIETSGKDAMGVYFIGDGASIVNNGLIRSTGEESHGILGEVGAEAVIVNNGSVETEGLGSHGIVVDGPRAQVRNSETGNVVISGENAVGLFLLGPNSQVVNDGLVRILNDGSTGIAAAGSGSTVRNAGQIETTGFGTTGIIVGDPAPLVTVSDVTVSNDGSIRTSGEGSHGVAARGERVSISNSGSINSSGLASGGIVVDGIDASISNAGTIRVSGPTTIGIGVGRGVGPSDNAVVRNSGSIIVSGVGSIGVGTDGDNAVVTNSGKIVSDGDAAILFGGHNARLNLLAGTAIQGDIIFGGLDNTVAFGSGLNAMMTFSGILPDVVMAGDRPFVVSGDKVAVLDTAGFSSAHAVVADLTGNIAGAVEDRLAVARGEGFRGVFGVTGDLPFDADAVPEKMGPVFWATALGGYRSQDGSDDEASFRNALGGVMFGLEGEVSDHWRGGGFIGGAGGSARVDGSIHDIDHSSFFGGGYLGYASLLNFADLSLSVGSMRQNSDRRIANNTVQGGIETAHARFDGVYVSPSVAVGTRMEVGGTVVVPSLRLRYAGLFVDGYEERGAEDALTVDSRNVHVFEARGQVAVPLTPWATESGVLATRLRAGIDGIAQSRGRVSATLLGEDIVFTPGGDRGAIRGFAGADFTFVNAPGMQINGTVEAGYGSDQAFIAVARAGLSIAF